MGHSTAQTNLTLTRRRLITTMDLLMLVAEMMALSALPFTCLLLVWALTEAVRT